MDLTWFEALVRWVHVVAGILWVGHLYFFNFVNAQVAKTYDPESRKKVVPELMPRALYWFRWGAAYTWASGVLLAWLVYYSVENLIRRDVATNAAVMPHGAAVAVSLALVLGVFFVYEVVWRALGARERVAVGVLFAILVAVLFGLSFAFTGRALFIQTGMMMGTIMAMNVWMRIWPAQRKIIQGVKGVAPAPDAAVPVMATLRSKHNAYMSLGLVFTMLSNHYPTIYGADHAWLVLSAILALAFAVTKLIYLKSTGKAPALYGAPGTEPSGGTHGMAAPRA